MKRIRKTYKVSAQSKRDDLIIFRRPISGGAPTPPPAGVLWEDATSNWEAETDNWDAI